MTYEEFVYNWNTKILASKPDSIRTGQSLMNYLSEIMMDEYVNITSVHYYNKTDIDCFYNDDLIPNTLKHLETIWPCRKR
jgi:hypothetical protein